MAELYTNSICAGSATIEAGAGPWYALCTRHQHEKAVARALACKGFKVYLPLYIEMHHWKDRVKEVSLPLFPSYVFLRGGLERRLDILTTPGFHGFVSVRGFPAGIPEAEIEAVHRAVERSEKIEPHPFLKCGDWVRVKSGPLAGIEGILVRKKNLYRLVLSVELLGRSASVEIEAHAVERVFRPPAMSAPPRSVATAEAGFRLG